MKISLFCCFVVIVLYLLLFIQLPTDWGAKRVELGGVPVAAPNPMTSSRPKVRHQHNMPLEDSARVRSFVQPSAAGLYHRSLGDVALKAGLVLIECAVNGVRADSAVQLFLEPESAGNRGPAYPIPPAVDYDRVSFFSPRSVTTGLIDVVGLGVIRVEWAITDESSGIGECLKVSSPAPVVGVHGAVVGVLKKGLEIEIVSCEGVFELDQDYQFFFETEVGICDVQVCEIRDQVVCCSEVNELSIEGGNDNIVELIAPNRGQCDVLALSQKPWSCESGGDFFRLLSAKVEVVVEAGQVVNPGFPIPTTMTEMPTRMWQLMFPYCTEQERDSAREAMPD